MHLSAWTEAGSSYTSAEILSEGSQLHFAIEERLGKFSTALLYGSSLIFSLNKKITFKVKELCVKNREVPPK